MKLVGFVSALLLAACAPSGQELASKSESTPYSAKSASENCVMDTWGAILNHEPQTFSLREEFEVKSGEVSAFDFSEIKGEYGKIFVFFLEGDGCFAKAVSIGSYNDVTQVSRELGNIGPDQRIYHADIYEPGLHSTLGFFDAPPDYETARKIAVDALQ